MHQSDFWHLKTCIYLRDRLLTTSRILSFPVPEKAGKHFLQIQNEFSQAVALAGLAPYLHPVRRANVLLACCAEMLRITFDEDGSG